MVKLIFQNIRQYQIADLIKKTVKSCVSSVIYVHNFHYVRFLPLFSTSHSLLKIKPKLLTRTAPSILGTTLSRYLCQLGCSYISLFRLLYLEIFRVQNLEISRLCTLEISRRSTIEISR